MKKLIVIFILFSLSLPVAGTTVPAKAAIASAHPYATEAGHQTLAAGGNAFDAAITVAAVLAVVEPYSSGIGGGGFWLLHRAKDGYQTMLDGRERAPADAHRDLYLDDAGEVVPGLSVNGPLSAGIPGEPAALAHLASRYGRLPLKQSLAAAIRFAEQGFEVDEIYQRMAQWRLEQMQKWPATRRQLLLDGAVPALGYKIRQPDLARTLKLLADKGAAGFYQGELAQQLVNGVRQAGGIWKMQDLADYKVVEREPIRGQYRGLEIVSAAPPSSGGIVLVSMLNMLSRFDLEAISPVDKKHLLVESMRRAYRDRADYMGDPDFVSIPTGQLIDPDYAAGLVRDIQLRHASKSTSTYVSREKGRDTTHYSILDQEGNRVSATLSINYPFGSCFIAPGTGVLLNDEMDDFSAQPGVPNVYGLVGGEANAIAPGKRMLSSMTPTFVQSEDVVAILGTPGGSRIITMLLHGVLSLSEGEPVSDWVSRPRFHHQYLPDHIQFEPAALTEQEQAELKARGHELKPLQRTYGNMQAVFWNRKSGAVSAASDPRGLGAAEIR